MFQACLEGEHDADDPILPSAVLSLLLFCPTLNAEDVRLREQAVQLMERANAASLLAGFRDYEQVLASTFHDYSMAESRMDVFPYPPQARTASATN